MSQQQDWLLFNMKQLIPSCILMEEPILKLDIDDFYTCYLNLQQNQINTCGYHANHTISSSNFNTCNSSTYYCAGGSGIATHHHMCTTSEHNHSTCNHQQQVIANCSSSVSCQQHSNIINTISTRSQQSINTNSTNIIFCNESPTFEVACTRKQNTSPTTSVASCCNLSRVKKPKKQQKFKNHSQYVAQHSKRRSLFTRKNSNHQNNPIQSSMQLNFPVLTFHTFVLE